MSTSIPFALIPPAMLEKIYRPFMIVGHLLETTIFHNFNLKLQQARMTITSGKYWAMCFANDLILSIMLSIFVFLIANNSTKLKTSPLLIAILSCIGLIGFMLFQQRAAPEIYIKKRVDDLEKNTLPALQNFLIQLRSGIPLFDIMVNVAASDYGEVSKEFMNVVKKINGGIPQVEALERMALENPSGIFRSAIWQMVNGLKTGSNLTDVLREIMAALADEQILQVEQYGSVLSPLTMFYMIMAVILPAIGVNFLIVIVSFMNLDMGPTKIVFWCVYGFILIVQLMFINIIKTKRPSLLKSA